MTGELKRLRTGPSLHALGMYIDYYYPCLTDKSGLVAVAGCPNPRTREGVGEMHDAGVSK